MMRPCRYEYSKFRDMDIFLSHSDKLIGRIIKVASLMKIDLKDESTPTHGGFIVNNFGQFFAAEMKPRYVENSLKKYTGRFEQIIEVWRFKTLDKAIRIDARRYLAYLHREQKNYDASGAILSSKLGQIIFGKMPWFKNNKEGHFCTEMSSDVIRKFMDPLCPEAPSPLDQSRYFSSRPELYLKIEGYKHHYE
jgi:hypothetical protein